MKEKLYSSFFILIIIAIFALNYLHFDIKIIWSVVISLVGLAIYASMIVMSAYFIKETKAGDVEIHKNKIIITYTIIFILLIVLYISLSTIGYNEVTKILYFAFWSAVISFTLSFIGLAIHIALIKVSYEINEMLDKNHF